MYILKNAVTSIRRSKGRNILIGIIIIVIATSCTITLAIRQSANNIISAYEEKNKIEATIGMNREYLMQSLRDGDKSQEEMINAFNAIEAVSEEDINKYGESKYVSEYYYTYELSVDAKDLTEATDSLVRETTEVKTETSTKTQTRSFPQGGSGGPGGPGRPGGNGGGSQTRTQTTKKTTTTKTEKIFNEKAQDGAFTLIGYNSYEDMKDFINGNYTITSGEVSSDFDSNSCVISEELATLNNLSVGDTITIVDPKNTSKTYELTITGIYKENTSDSTNMVNMFTSSANEIITNVNFIKSMISNDEELKPTITPTFIIKDKDSVTKFADEVSEKGLSEYYQVTNNLSEIESATEVVNNVKVFATTFLIITLGIGGVVLIVINMINIRERKYEIGVLRTIGMKKSKVSLQFMSELLIVCIISLMIGAVAGSFLSIPVSNKLLENEIANSTSKYEDISKNFGRGERTENKNKIEESKTTDENETTDENKETEANTSKETSKDNKKSNEKYDFGLAQINEVNSIDEVNQIINDLKIEHKKARHIVYAYRVNSLEKNYSDKEPNGTTRGLLDLIHLKNKENTLIVVIRYFGGVLLGSGPLTRAYTKVSSDLFIK